MYNIIPILLKVITYTLWRKSSNLCWKLYQNQNLRFFLGGSTRTDARSYVILFYKILITSETLQYHIYLYDNQYI